MGTLRQTIMQDMERAGYVKGTKEAYLECIRGFAKFHGRSPEEMGREEVRQWVDHLKSRGLSAQRLGQHFAALRFLYKRTLGRAEVVSFLRLPRRAKRLPVVLSIEDVSRLLQAVVLLKYRVFLTTIYATGLRISETCHLQTSDVDASRGVIQVRNGKGHKDRLVGLCPQLLQLLRGYWKVEHPAAPWLFASQNGGPFCARSAQRALAAATKQAGINKRVTPHVLRHCFATHLIEQGTELRVIQVLLGHASILSTTRYAQVSAGMIAKTPSPLDLLNSNG